MNSSPPPDGPLSNQAVRTMLESHRVPGASIAVIEHGELTAAYTYGIARVDHMVEPHTRFQVASISKFVNALAVLRLVQTGVIGIDDPVNRHLKSWQLPDNELTANAPVTVRMLLNHTGGTSVHGFPGYSRTEAVPALLQILDGAPPANTVAIRVVKPPGQAYMYSGGGTTILQQMVIDLADQNYETALQCLVLKPLAMSESSFDQNPNTELVAFGHAPDGSEVPGGFRFHPEQAAAGLWTTPRDLCKALLEVMRAHAGETHSFLTHELARLMLTSGPGQTGLGVYISDGGGFYHGGSNVGFRALCGANPLRRRGFVALTNGDGGDLAHVGLRDRIAEAYGWSQTA